MLTEMCNYERRVVVYRHKKGLNIWRPMERRHLCLVANGLNDTKGTKTDMERQEDGDMNGHKERLRHKV